MKNNIVLIGMPGIGKSTIGVILAKLIGYRFMDSDLVIQEQEGKLLKDIIEEKGTKGFLEVENRINAQISPQKTVIATGGSVVYGEEAMAHFKDIATIIYLKASYPVIEARLSNIKNRGVVIEDGQTLEDLYNERIVLYEKYADITVEEHDLTVEETLELLTQKLDEYNSIHK